MRPDCKTLEMASDASGSWGCGAWHGTKWFQLPWDDNSKDFPIAVKELVPIIIAAIVWGHEWKGCLIKAQCDNEAVVAVLKSKYSKESHLMHMLRILFFVEAHWQFNLSASHVPGKWNHLADHLSRNELDKFHAKFPESCHQPSTVPPSILQWLLDPKINWTSQSWIQQFNIFVNRE